MGTSRLVVCRVVAANFPARSFVPEPSDNFTTRQEGRIIEAHSLPAVPFAQPSDTAMLLSHLCGRFASSGRIVGDTEVSTNDGLMRLLTLRFALPASGRFWTSDPPVNLASLVFRPVRPNGIWARFGHKANSSS